MSTHEHGAQSGSKALGPTPLLSGAANQAKQLKSRFNSWERFCEAHPQARVAIAVQSGYSHEIKFFCHSIVFWEEFKDFFTERCAAAGSRSELGVSGGAICTEHDRNWKVGWHQGE